MKERDFYRPNYNFYGDINVNPPYIGFELEVNPAGSICERKIKFEDFCEAFNADNSKFGFKYDCSIGEYGVEIVSHPGTLSWHKEDGFVQEIFEKINKQEMTYGCGCGLHFHVDKRFFTKNDMEALDCFANRPQIMRRLAYVGGRDLNYFCACLPHKTNWGVSRGRTALFFGKNTIEFRFCNSTSSIDEFFKRMELIYCLSHFSKTIVLDEMMNNIDEYIMNKFLDFVKKINLENLKVENFCGSKTLYCE